MMNRAQRRDRQAIMIKIYTELNGRINRLRLEQRRYNDKENPECIKMEEKVKELMGKMATIESEFDSLNNMGLVNRSFAKANVIKLQGDPASTEA